MAEQNETNRLIDKALLDSILLQRLCDKIYELMVEDLKNQRDRTGNFRR